MLCPNCRNYVTDGAPYCIRCGATLSTENSPFVSDDLVDESDGLRIEEETGDDEDYGENEEYDTYGNDGADTEEDGEGLSDEAFDAYIDQMRVFELEELEEEDPPAKHNPALKWALAIVAMFIFCWIAYLIGIALATGAFSLMTLSH